MRIILFFLTLFFTVSTNAQQSYSYVLWKNYRKEKQLTEDQEKNWQYLDIEDDTIPGVSLNRAYNEFFYDKNGKNVVVAVLDTEIDIDHPALKKISGLIKKK